MKIFLFLASRRGYAVFKKLIAAQAQIAGILCLVEDPHEEQVHLKISALATEQAIPFFYSLAVKPAEYAALLQKIKPDIAFAIGWRYLISQEAYTLPPRGTLIIHDSLLPRYRGFAPMNWAIINGEKETGVSLFHIAEGVDCGPIVDQLATPIYPEDTAKTVDERLITLYEEIIIKNIPALEAGTAKAIPQEEAQATYCCKRTPEDGEIHWQQSAEQIYNLIRGCTQPFPGAYTLLKGKKIFIWEAKVVAAESRYVGNIPGRVIGKTQDCIEVLTTNGILGLKRLQYLGEAEKTAAELTISVKDTLGR
jgi:methionyl-tRNA formyltransferase